MSGNNGFVDVGDMIHQIGDLCSVLVRQTIPRGVGDIDDGGAGFDHCFYYPGQVFFFCTACIFGVKFDIIDKSTGIFYGLYRSPDDFVGSGIQFFVDMIPGGTDSGMDTSPFSKFQCFGSHFDVFFYSPGQSTDGWNGYCFRNLYNGIEIPGTRDGETGFDDVYTQFLELPGNFYLFDCIQLTPRNLLCIPKGGIEYIYFFTHEVMR